MSRAAAPCALRLVPGRRFILICVRACVRAGGLVRAAKGRDHVCALTCVLACARLRAYVRARVRGCVGAAQVRDPQLVQGSQRKHLRRQGRRLGPLMRTDSDVPTRMYRLGCADYDAPTRMCRLGCADSDVPDLRNCGGIPGRSCSGGRLARYPEVAAVAGCCGCCRLLRLLQGTGVADCDASVGMAAVGVG